MIRTATLALLVALAAVPAQAQDAGPLLLAGIAAEDLQTVVDSVAAAYEIEATFETVEADEGTRVLNVDAGLRFSFVLYGCDAEAGCPVVTAFATFEGPAYAEQLNRWNRAARFSRAYVDGDGDAVVEADLLLAGGITEQSVQLFVNAFFVSMAEFAEFLNPTPVEDEAAEAVDDGGR